VRRAPRAGEIAWDPARGQIDAGAFDGLDAVVHLSGEAVAGGRWTDARKREILRSRTAGTDLLARTLAGLRRPPKVLLSASAVGIYGASAANADAVDEDGLLGDDFLADVCRRWEAAAEPARAAGLRVITLRIGIVLTPAGGALAQMLPAFRAGLGGPLGAGTQPVSWISVDDTIAAIHHALHTETLAGPLNVVAPRAVDNAELAATLGRVLRRPVVLRVPAAAIDLLFGEMGRLTALGGARVRPRHLAASGFVFDYPELEPALRHTLGISRTSS
jgi:uncharacterized protein (TIGR01777 family)